MSKKRKKNRYDVDNVRREAEGRWLEILTDVAGIPADLLDGRHHPCPRCGGTDRFRLVDEAAGAVLCNQCFKERNGDGFAATQWMRGGKFMQAVALVANHLGMEGWGEQKKSTRKLAEEQLEWLDWHPLLIKYWCMRKPPINLEALEKVGAKYARYLYDYTVVAIPVWGKKLNQGDPVGWVLFNTTGRGLPVYDNKEIVEWVKVKTLAGSKSGLMGTFGDGGLTIKTEGPTDMLSLISQGHNPNETIVCNVHGCGENPRNTPWMSKFFSGRDVITIGDNDQPGQAGAVNWGRYAAVTASSSKVAKLPGPVLKSKGPDLRDYFEDHTREDLDEIFNKAIPVDPDEGTQLNESVDDPHRLARVNLEQYASNNNGATIRFWNGSWWLWKRNHYIQIEDADLRGRVNMAIKREFNRINIEEQEEFQQRKEDGLTEDGEKPPYCRKVTPQLVGSVLSATKGIVTLPKTVSLGDWVPDSSPRDYIAMANGILDVEAVLANKDTKDCLLPHSPDWFSKTYLPYEFDPKATCPKWEAFLEKNLEGDEERIRCLQEWAGYLLLPSTNEQKFMILEGEGANGKSVFCAGIEAILGSKNCSHVPFEIFGDRFSKTSTLGKLVNICGDVGEIDKDAEGIIKLYTGGGVVNFDRKGLPSIECVPTARLMLACNTAPRFRDRTDGIWRRLLIVPWKLQIQPHERIPGMDKARWWEKTGELPGMFRWALLGLIRLSQQKAFTSSYVMAEHMEEYKKDSNPARQFVADKLEHSKSSAPLRSSYLYSMYRSWATSGGFYPLSSSQFGKEIKRSFPEAERVFRGNKGKRTYCYINIDYRDGEIPPEDSPEAYLG